MITIRHYRGADLEALVRLINEADAVDRLERGTSLEELGEKFGVPDYHPEENLFVAQDEKGRIVGYGSLYLEKDEPESIVAPTASSIPTGGGRVSGGDSWSGSGNEPRSGKER